MKTEPNQIKKLYYSIGEVSRITNLQPYVLRYWETEFRQLSPPKNRAGNRTYRQKDIEIIEKIKNLLYEKKFTIKGAKSFLDSKEEIITPQVQVEQQSSKNHISEDLIKVKQELENILEYIRNH